MNETAKFHQENEYPNKEETSFLLTSKKNRKRLFQGIEQVNGGKTTKVNINEL